ncbi:MAG TPA: hypothetical protein VMB03_19585 [Bryobacteraceae bacterium]|nr:hypothetical protein [Bryobacteraceae bacterium]
MIRRTGLIACAALGWCPVFAWAQRPSDADTAALIEKSRQKALDYTQSLPDFLCSEIIQRFAAPAVDGTKAGGWTHTDTLRVTVSYSQGSEGHKLELINGKATGKKFEELGGETSSGEFGGILRTVFDPASQAAFDWESSKTVHGRRMAVYQYAISAANSPFYLRNNNRKGIVGLHGTVEVDAETGEVGRLTYIAYDIPKGLEVQASSATVEYGLASVAGRNYLLPAHSEGEMHSSEMWARSKMDFRDYRKFTADSTITFGGK